MQNIQNRNECQLRSGTTEDLETAIDRPLPKQNSLALRTKHTLQYSRDTILQSLLQHTRITETAAGQCEVTRHLMALYSSGELVEHILATKPVRGGLHFVGYIVGNSGRA